MQKKVNTSLLEIKNLHARIKDTEVLHGANLAIQSGEIHAIMGPNGSGKSTLAHAILGNPKFTLTGGDIRFRGKSILGLDTTERARQGIFLAFQYPREISGISLSSFLWSVKRSNTKEKISVLSFAKEMKAKAKELNMNPKLLERNVNVGFSGGEKKKAEILAMLLLQPKLVILDEIDSGLDIDALKDVARVIQNFASKDRGILIITHYERILRYIKPDHVHVMSQGKIVKSGGREFAKEIEKRGYEAIVKD
jgi:Fe-S cluster assembly ATP-binding protein